MTDTINLTPETALQTLYVSLYPKLSEEDLPIADPTATEEVYIDLIGNPAVSKARSEFLDSWKTSVDLETRYQAETKTRHSSKLEEDKRTAHKITRNRLNLYVYAILKDKLEPPKGPVITPEAIQEATKSLRQYITLHALDNSKLDNLIQLLHTVHGKQKEFTTELVVVLQRETLLQHANLSQINNNLLKEKENLSKKLKTAEKKLEEIREDNYEVEKLKQNYNTTLKLSADCDQHVAKLQIELKAAKEQAEQLQSAADSNSQVDDLRQALKEEIERTTQLKTALDSKQRHIEKLEESSLEANDTLEEKVQESEKHILTLKQDNYTLQNKNVSLQKELDSAKQLNNQISTTKEQIQSSFKQITLHSKVQATEIADLKTFQGNLEQEGKKLNARIKDLEEREKVFKETEEFYGRNFQHIAKKTSHEAQAIEELKNLTSSDPNQSLQQELIIQGTNSEVKKIIDYLTAQNNDQGDIISDLQKRNSRALNTRRVSIPIMGMGAGLSHGAGGAGPSGANTSQDPTALTAQDTTILDNVTKPIVKVLGELFSREDKKSIPAFKGKSTDKLITEWLKAAEHVARNNDWDDDQKIRFFSDRLKGEALEWHDNYIEEQGNTLNYEDWRKDIIERFQDSFDLATLRKKLHTLKQKPEENCRAFVSRLNNLYDTIEGKVDKLDDKNKTVVEDHLLSKVRKMRNDVKIKILLQALLPKIKSELYLRIPTDCNDFEKLCEQLFISEQILQNKESNEDKELTAVIAGITHHEKQQDEELTQQKLEIGSLKQKLAELENFSKRRHSSQEQLTTIAAVDHYDSRRSSSLDRHPRRDSRVQFSRPSPSQSRDSSFSRQQGRNNSYSRSRDQSPAHHRENQFHNNKRSYSNNQPRYQSNFRNRPVQRYRSQQDLTSRNNYRNQNGVRNNFSRTQAIIPRQNNNNSSQNRGDSQRQTSSARRDITCYNCGKKGHISRECWTDMARANQPYNHNN